MNSERTYETTQYYTKFKNKLKLKKETTERRHIVNDNILSFYQRSSKYILLSIQLLKRKY